MAEMYTNDIQEYLRGDYNKVYSRFTELIKTKSFDSVVLVTRRAYVLYKLFSNVIQQEEFDLDKKKYYTTHSMWMIPSGCSVLIFDDIIVNGGTIERTISALEDMGHKNISVWCVWCNGKAVSYKKFVNKYNLMGYRTSPSNWKYHSNNLNDTIVKLNIGNTSIVDTFILGSNQLKPHVKSESISIVKEWFIKSKDYHVCDFDNHESDILSGFVAWLQPNEENLSIVKDAFIKDKNIKFSNNIKVCFRFYSNQDHVLFIPYVFLPDMSKAEICASFSSPYSNIDFDEKDSDNKVMWLYKYIIYTISIKYAQYFRNTSGFNIKKCLNCNESFPLQIPQNENSEDRSLNCHEVINTRNDNINLLCSYEFKDEDLEFCNDLLKDVIVRHTNQKNVSFRQILHEYFGIARKVDCERVIDSREHISGIRPDDILMDMNQTNVYNNEWLLTQLIYSWDNGESTLVIRGFVNEKGIKNMRTVIVHGEQAFKSYYSAYSDVFPYFYALFLETGDGQKEHIKRFANYCAQKINGNKKERFISFSENVDENNYVSDLIGIDMESMEKYNKELFDIDYNIMDIVLDYIKTIIKKNNTFNMTE